MTAVRISRLLRPGVLESIDPERLFALLHPYADFFANRSVPIDAPGSIDCQAVIREIAKADRETPADLLDAISLIDELANTVAVDLLLDRVPAETLGIAPGGKHSSADIVTAAWLSNREKLVQTHALSRIKRVRSYDYFQASQTTAPKFVTPAEETLQQLERDIDSWHVERFRAQGTKVEVFENDEEVEFSIMHGSLFRRQTVVENGRFTFCIKTIHRPQCCATLVRSIYEHCGDERPLIYVLDDGKPELRFSQVCPEEAAMVDRLIETEYDIGLSAGRNRLVEAAQTRMVIFSDDDHVVGPQTRLNDLVRKFESSRLDLLATLSKQPHRPNPDGTPRLLNSSGGVLHIPRGEYRRTGDIAECAFVCNCFVAHRDILQAIRWDEDLKVDEHWDFFWRAKIAGVRVGVAMDHVFPHIHVDPPAYKRHRPMFLRAALRKHGLRKVLWK